MTLVELHQNHVQKSASAHAKIGGFHGDPWIIERLKEMGLHQGLEVEVMGQAPFGGPLLFRFGNTVLALRKEEAACTLIEM